MDVTDPRPRPRGDTNMEGPAAPLLLLLLLLELLLLELLTPPCRAVKPKRRALVKGREGEIPRVGEESARMMLSAGA